MPTLHLEAGYVFEMVMRDCEEPRHVHVKGNRKGGAKFWLSPDVEQGSPGGYNEHELGKIRKIIRDNLATMITKWDQECARIMAKGKTR